MSTGLAHVLDIEERKALFLREFEKVPYPGKALLLAGAQHHDLGYWKKTDPEFSKKYREIREGFKQDLSDTAETVVVDVLRSEKPNPWLAVRVLEQFNDDWKRETPNSLSQVNIETVILNPSTLDHTTLSNTETGTTGGGMSSPEPGGDSGSDGT